MKDAAYYLSQAKRCRELASAALDQELRTHLLGMAGQYEEEAERLGQEPEPPMPNAE